MKKNKLTCAHAIVKYLIAQKILINGKKEPLFPGVFGIFGHGNVAYRLKLIDESQIRDHEIYYDDFWFNKILSKTNWILSYYKTFQFGLNSEFILSIKD